MRAGQEWVGKRDFVAAAGCGSGAAAPIKRKKQGQWAVVEWKLPG